MCEALRQDAACGLAEELEGGRKARRPDGTSGMDGTSVMRAHAQSLGFILGHWGAPGSFKARERFAQTGQPQGCNVCFFHTVAS